ncbi:MAG: hypothetical protein JNL40_03660 [Cyclobacteriaceae bacterium]|nr:hypothetical protein [Cyclobacteriaceae bacterium]
MKIRTLLSLILALLVASAATGQKIKYKDLFVLLSAKQYSEAEPFLKKYLKDNTDNPNAYLYMGLILEDKAAHADILKETERYSSLLDSAVLYFALANKGMTEKEVSRNEDYYQMYNRRDLRTGNFGVKHSDVLLDIETRMKLKDRAKLALKLKSQFKAAEASYLQSLRLYGKIQALYPDMKQLYLQSDDSLTLRLNHLASVYDSCHIHFNDYKATAKVMGKIGYNQDLNPQDILDFKRQQSAVDFYADDIKLQDFKRWALSTEEVIRKEIQPLRDQLVARDAELNKLQQQIKKDSVSVVQDLRILRGKGFPELLKIDPNPLPIQVFQMKEAEIEFGSQVSENRPLRDSASLALQVAGLKKEIALAHRLDSIANYLVERDVEAELANYRHFVNTAYGSTAVLKSLIRGTRELALREIIRRESAIKRKTDALQWIVDGADSIPLMSPAPEQSKFKPLVQQEEKFTSGLTFADSLGTGYFYTISPSRKVAVKATYKVNPDAFKKRYLPVTKAMAIQDELGLVFFVLTYQETKMKDKYQATLTKIYKVEGLAWSVNLELDQLPIELVFTKESSEIIIKTKSSIGEVFAIVFDRDGKPIK